MGGNLYIGTSTDAYATSSPAALSITNAGNVGIGTTNPDTAHLYIRGTTVGPQIYSISKATTGDNYAVDAEATGVGATTNVGGYFYASGATNNYAIIVPSGGGNVGIGDTTPDALLDVKGTVCLDLNADEACTDNTSAISDARLKTNVVNLTGSLGFVNQLRPRPLQLERHVQRRHVLLSRLHRPRG